MHCTLLWTVTRTVASHLVKTENSPTLESSSTRSGSNNTSLARMQTFLSPVTSSPVLQPLATGDSIRASVGHLLTRAYSLPCSTAALAFNQLVQPTSRFQLALDALLPLLDSNTTAEVSRLSNKRCLAAQSDQNSFSLRTEFWFLSFCIHYMHHIPSPSTLSNLRYSLRMSRRGKRRSKSPVTAVLVRTSSWSGCCGRF